MMSTESFYTTRQTARQMWKLIDMKRRDQLLLRRRICNVIHQQTQTNPNGTRYAKWQNVFINLVNREDDLVADIWSLVQQAVILRKSARLLKNKAKSNQQNTRIRCNGTALNL